MFKIGDFSRLSRVPVKTLRYYDEIGLLKPIGVDRFTRYRYYALEQLPALYRILGLKELGFSLEQISQLLAAEFNPEQLHRLLELRRIEIEQNMEQERLILRRLETRTKEIEQIGRMPEYEVILKRVEPQWVATKIGFIPSYNESEQVLHGLFGEIEDYLARQGLCSHGRRIVLYGDSSSSAENIQIEAALAISAPFTSTELVTVRQLPALESAASVVHQGPLAAIGKAYAAGYSWVQANGDRINAPIRELYLHYPAGDAKNQYTIEIQFPLKIQKEKMKMEPKLVSLPAFKVVGLRYIGDNPNNEIGQMWGVFNQRCPEILHQAPMEAAYGICYPHPTARLEYYAALKVTELADLPEGMFGKEIPAQTYVVFPCHGLDQIGETYHKIIHEWLPANGYQPGDGPDFEYYGEEFNPVNDEENFYIYFPVKKGLISKS